jgi:hypothetical protein
LARKVDEEEDYNAKEPLAEQLALLVSITVITIKHISS